MFAFVVFVFIFQYLAKRLAGKNVSKMTYFCPVGRKTLINHDNKREYVFLVF